MFWWSLINHLLQDTNKDMNGKGDSNGDNFGKSNQVTAIIDSL